MFSVADQRRTRPSDCVRQLVLHHLDDVAHNRLPLIQKKTGYDMQVVKEAIASLRQLNPRPGQGFAHTHTQYVEPDVIVEKDEASGEFIIKLVKDIRLDIIIQPRYQKMLGDKTVDPSTRKYIREKRQAAEWLRSAIAQRQNTLEKVSKAIFEHQKAFLQKGPEAIEPLKMQQIADQIGVHVTTVSRAVDDKWVLTPRGLYPLKRFFGGGTRNELTGEDVAYELIRRKLTEFVSEEDKASPLSDEEIVEKFKASGYTVARRTVTKYRKLLAIPSSRERREWA